MLSEYAVSNKKYEYLNLTFNFNIIISNCGAGYPWSTSHPCSTNLERIPVPYRISLKTELLLTDCSMNSLSSMNTNRATPKFSNSNSYLILVWNTKSISPWLSISLKSAPPTIVREALSSYILKFRYPLTACEILSVDNNQALDFFFGDNAITVE